MYFVIIFVIYNKNNIKLFIRFYIIIIFIYFPILYIYLLIILLMINMILYESYQNFQILKYLQLHYRKNIQKLLKIINKIYCPVPLIYIYIFLNHFGTYFILSFTDDSLFSIRYLTNSSTFILCSSSLLYSTNKSNNVFFEKLFFTVLTT